MLKLFCKYSFLFDIGGVLYVLIELALLHDRLYQACQFYLKRGFCTLEDRDNLEYMFKPYKALGGNGTGEELYNRCLALPYESTEREDKK